MPDLVEGAVFAGHRIDGVAGRGGVGVVYRATHLALDHPVALKVISPQLADDAAWRARFTAESRAAFSIRHPNVVAVHHAGEEEGLMFVTMDLVEGTDLRRRLLEEGPLEPEHATRMLSAVAAALDAAHERGLVHRDVKPSNILIAGSGEAEHVYLTDFGLTKRIDATSDVTATGAFVGTIDYVAPEQIRGERLDARTDVYALGCVLFQMLSGESPFGRLEEQIAKLYAHLQDEPPRLLERAPGVPPQLDAVVARALEKEPAKRYASAGDLARAAEAAIRGDETTTEMGSVAVGAAAPPTEEISEQVTVANRLPAARRRFRSLLAGAAAVAVAGVVLTLALGGDGGAGQRESASSGGAKSVGEPIAVEGMPVGIGVHDDALWVGQRTANSVSQIDLKSGAIAQTIRDLPAPEGVAVGPDAIWVALGGGDSIARIDRDDSAVTTVAVGEFPRAVAVSPGSLWVTNARSNTVSRVDPASQQEVQEIAVGPFPHGVAVGEGGVWVSNRDDATVSRIDFGTGEVTNLAIPVGPQPKGIAIARSTVWVANTGDGTVTPIDAQTQQPREPIEIGGEPRGVVAAFGSVWAANGSGSVDRIDPATGRMVESIEVGVSPEQVTAGGDSIWVTDGEGEQIFRIQP